MRYSIENMKAKGMLALISLIISIFMSGCVGSNPINEASKTEVLEITWDELVDMYFELHDEELTELQKEEIFDNKYKNKIIKTNAFMSRISKEKAGYIPVHLENPGSTLLPLAILYFKSSTSKEQLLELDVYSEIIFEGKLKSYSDLTGFIIKNPKIIEVIE